MAVAVRLRLLRSRNASRAGLCQVARASLAMAVTALPERAPWLPISCESALPACADPAVRTRAPPSAATLRPRCAGEMRTGCGVLDDAFMAWAPALKSSHPA